MKCESCDKDWFCMWKDHNYCEKCFQDRLNEDIFKEQGTKIKEIKKLISNKLGREIIAIWTIDGEIYRLGSDIDK